MYLKLREDCLELFYTCLSEGTIFNTMSLKELFAEAQFEIEGDEENMKKENGNRKETFRNRRTYRRSDWSCTKG